MERFRNCFGWYPVKYIAKNTEEIETEIPSVFFMPLRLCVRVCQIRLPGERSARILSGASEITSSTSSREQRTKGFAIPIFEESQRKMRLPARESMTRQELMGYGQKRFVYDYSYCVCMFGTPAEPVVHKDFFALAKRYGVEP